MSAQAAPARTGIFYGWWIVVTGCIFAFYGYSVYAYGIANFVPVWNRDMGWSFAAIGLGFTFQSVASGIEGPPMGWLVDKFGPRYIQMLRPGIRTRSHRETSSAVYHVLAGAGHSLIDGVRFDWTPGDFFVVPPRAGHEHANAGADPAILFSFQDVPLLTALGLYHVEA